MTINKLIKKLIKKIRIKYGWYDLHDYGCLWVARHLGREYVQEFSDNYEKINCGVPIGNIYETIVFLNMIERMKKDFVEEDCE